MSNYNITLTIDAIEVTVPRGATIFQAARSIGIEIPHLCYDPELDLPPSASCRMCVVEVQGAPAPVASCTYPAAPNMVVYTDTQQLREIRLTIMELLLSEHTYECCNCATSGVCALEKYAYEMGLRKPSPASSVLAPVEPASDAPTLANDDSKCILCGRCVAVCHGVQGAGAIDFYGRGLDTHISLPPGIVREDSDCEWCGNCVAVCQTGAITAGRMSCFAGVSKIRTTCTYCGVGCQFDLNVRDNRIVGVTSNPDNPVNGRWLCVKGRFGYEFIQHKDRLTQPLIRRDGELKPA
jgi:formate dehydrogenase alpha subunit